LAEWLRRPDERLESLCSRAGGPELDGYSPQVLEAVEIAMKYAGYLEREQRLIERQKQMESKHIPASFDYGRIAQLRHEAREKLTRYRPRNLGQAARISGISPADIATLSFYLARRRESA
jgi:tRNA uridine 5-carboxymethylaminomethyl modification enzyme